MNLEREDAFSWRQLASENLLKIDYNVLSVAAMTLALLLVVEFIRHRLDDAAQSRPFFRAVLEGVYAELATLGLVELILHVFSEYYPHYNPARKEVFADVHFLLFYTAIVNALQSVHVAFVTRRVSQRIWVRTEMLELNHYVEIREEFQRVQHELDQLNNNTFRRTRMVNANRGKDSEEEADQELGQTIASGGRTVVPSVVEHEFQFNCHSVVVVWKSLKDRIRYPKLRRKYNDLLIQIRFHELRVHFLQAYNLPLKLKISDYLIRCEQKVLIKMVKVSSVAWLLLTSAVCLLYYILGMVFYNYQNETLVGTALTWIFFWSIGAVVVLSWLVSNKMKAIFRAIMHEKTLWDIHGTRTDEKERLSKQQLALFWGSEPKNVIAAIQFMQFGYAVAISTVVVFWKPISDGDVEMYWYLIAIFLCYALFVHVTGQLLPRYTLCTCLGQLVDESRLLETLALFRLEEAKQKQLELLESQSYDEDVLDQDSPIRTQEGVDGQTDSPLKVASPSLPQQAKTAVSLQWDQQSGAEQVDSVLGQLVLVQQATGLGSQLNSPVECNLDSAQTDHKVEDYRRLFVRQDGVRLSKSGRRKVVSDGVGAMTAMNRLDSEFDDSIESFYLPGITAEDKLAPLRNNTSFSVSGVPTGDTPEELARARRRSRHARQKTVSDGVATMVRLAETEAINGFRNDARRHKSVQQPGVNFDDSERSSASKLSRQSTRVDDGILMAELVKLDTDALRTNLPKVEQRRLRHREETKQKRKNRWSVITNSEAVVVAAVRARGAAMSSEDENALDRRKQVSDDYCIDRKRPVLLLAGNDEKKCGVAFSGNRSRLDARHLRKKSMSDGVATMAGLAGRDRQGILGHSFNDYYTRKKRPVDFIDTNEVQDELFDGNEGCYRNHHSRKKSMSDGVATMASPAGRGIFVHPLEASPSGSGAQTKIFQRVEDDELDSAHAAITSDQTIENGMSPLELSVPVITSRNKEVTDDDSVHSTASVDGYSDVDDGPGHMPSVSGKYTHDQVLRRSLREQLHDYFLSNRYVVVSNVFGTIFAFFLVGQRVEGFIHSEKIISDEYVSVHVTLDVAFWLLTGLFSLFLLASGLKFYLILYFGKIRTSRNSIAAVAGVMDTAISATCLTVLFIAEVNRCCEPDAGSNSRNLVAATEEKIRYADDLCSCLAFGSRTYGGLGTIEPYTSLVCLRAVRHWVARCFVDEMRKYNWPKADQIDAKTDHDAPEEGLLMMYAGKGYSGHLNHSENATVVASVWESTIGAHPHLVAQYGEFSGEILRAMLGVDFADRLPPVIADGDAAGAEVENDSKSARKNSLQRTKSFSLKTKNFSGLSAEAQEVILAGKLGRSVVKSASQLNLRSMDQIPATIVGDDTATPGSRDVGIASEQNLVFEIDNETHTCDYDLMFASPNARLVRKMRRCDRKLLPILDKWTVVDVVMTRFEMVYFDAVSADESALDGAAEGARQAIIATKGGKGLRLCDVSLGRRVVGRLSIGDIASIHVERIMPNESNLHVGDCPDVQVEQTEYWKSSSVSSHAHGVASDQTFTSDWNAIKQDRLTIETIHGHTLYLRFHSDLKDRENHSARLADEDEVHGCLNKNNAFQWAQTIGRLCGPVNLKQHLPHFGDETSEELRDFLVVVDAPNDFKGHRRSKSGDAIFRHLPKSLSFHRLHQRHLSVDAGDALAQGNEILPNVLTPNDVVPISSAKEPRVWASGKKLQKKVSFVDLRSERT